MNKLNFESRISLTRKNEELIKTVEELSSCYETREEFALKNSHLYAIRTSEICGPAVCVFGILVGVIAVAVAAAIAWVKVLPENSYDEISDRSIYSDIV